MYAMIPSGGAPMDSTLIPRSRRHRVAGRGPSLRRPTPKTPPELPEWARVRTPSQSRRLKTWFNAPPWWVQNIFAALLVGAFVAVVSIQWQKSISEEQATQATRLENLRFVRDRTSTG